MTLLLALATGCAIGAAAWIVDWRADAEMQQRFDSALLARAQALSELVRLRNGVAEFPARENPAAEFPGNATASWYELRCGNRTVARTASVPPPLADAAQPRFADVESADGRALRMVALRFTPPPDGAGDPAASSPCRLRYALDRGPLDEILGSLDLTLLGSLFGVCALVLLLAPWLVQRGLHPLSLLARAMANVGPDAPGRRLPDTHTRELEPLVVRFNEVLARMDAGLARERGFASGLAHELRTRLAELRTLVDVETHYPSGRDAHSLLAEAGAIGAELEATVNALLQLTRIESGLEQVHREAVPVGPLLVRAQARHAPAAAARGVRIEWDAPMQGTMIPVDPALTEIILDNLIGNAVAYSQAPGTVLLRVHEDALEVVNPAPALGEEDLSKFGQRFWRRDEGGSGHAGLGLALASAAARVQHMTLRFRLDETQHLHAVLGWGAISGA